MIRPAGTGKEGIFRFTAGRLLACLPPTGRCTNLSPCSLISLFFTTVKFMVGGGRPSHYINSFSNGFSCNHSGSSEARTCFKGNARWQNIRSKEKATNNIKNRRGLTSRTEMHSVYSTRRNGKVKLFHIQVALQTPV